MVFRLTDPFACKQFLKLSRLLSSDKLRQRERGFKVHLVASGCPLALLALHLGIQKQCLLRVADSAARVYEVRGLPESEREREGKTSAPRYIRGPVPLASLAPATRHFLLFHE